MEADFPSFRDSRSLVLDQPEIASSQEFPVEEKSIENNRQKRADVIVTTVTSTITSYSFSTTVVAKTFSLVAAGVLTCLPPGYSVC